MFFILFFSCYCGFGDFSRDYSLNSISESADKIAKSLDRLVKGLNDPETINRIVPVVVRTIRELAKEERKNNDRENSEIVNKVVKKLIEIQKATGKQFPYDTEEPIHDPEPVSKH